MTALDYQEKLPVTTLYNPTTVYLLMLYFPTTLVPWFIWSIFFIILNFLYMQLYFKLSVSVCFFINNSFV